MSKRRRIQSAIEFSSGLISLSLSNILCYLFFTLVIPRIVVYDKQSWISYAVCLMLSYIVIFLNFFSPLNLLKRSKPMEMLSTLKNCVLTYTAFAIVLILTKNDIIDSRYLFISSFTMFFVIWLGMRFVIKKVMLSKISDNKHATQTGIITVFDRAEDFLPKLMLDWSKNIKAVALLDATLEGGEYRRKINSVTADGSVITSALPIDKVCGVPVVACKDNLMGWIKTAALDEVYINLPTNENDEYVAELIEELEDMGITVIVNIPSLEAIVAGSKFDNINCIVKTGYPMAIFSPAVHSEKSLAVKRFLDIVGGILGSIIALILLIIFAIPIMVQSKGSPIFKQPRVGKNGRIFNCYKLRSMYVDAEERKKALMEQNKMDGLMFKVDDDPRITKIGKFIRKYSIDEFPQFWNVLKGDMSLVGTRPPTVDEFEKYESHHKRRLSLKPGITGLWQVSGRSNIKDFETVVNLDCEYIDEWSIWLDIKILIKTIGVVLTHKGAE